MITIKIYPFEIYLTTYSVNLSFIKNEIAKIKENRKQIFKFYVIF